VQSLGQIRPTYAESFRCIGSACEDTCCHGWSVPVDRASWEKYQQLPDVPLAALIRENVQLQPAQPDGAAPAHFARMQLRPDGYCPMLSEEKLCRIQSGFGEELLSQTCATYPRIVNTVDGAPDKALALSCPEAARHVLLNPDLWGDGLEGIPGEERPESAAHNDPESLYRPLAHFWAIRACALTLLGERSYPLWQRLFLLGLFCRRLDEIAAGTLRQTVPNFLLSFQVAVSQGSLLPALENLPVDRDAQLDVVLRLAGLMLNRSGVLPRFSECVAAFTSGIDNGPEATLQSLSARYAEAHDRFFTPFMSRNPHILENYLLNTILRLNFPFGKTAGQSQSATTMTQEYGKLLAQFALMKGLLIGVAGHHRASFAAEHVVHTFQTASKHFEHHPEFLTHAYNLLVESRMDGARGMAILLRNAPPVGVSKPVAPAREVPAPRPGAQVMVQ
jgi:lysine-N-methylase